jgi:hypothetical protein
VKPNDWMGRARELARDHDITMLVDTDVTDSERAAEAIALALASTHAAGKEEGRTEALGPVATALGMDSDTRADVVVRNVERAMLYVNAAWRSEHDGKFLHEIGQGGCIHCGMLIGWGDPSDVAGEMWRTQDCPGRLREYMVFLRERLTEAQEAAAATRVKGREEGRTEAVAAVVANLRSLRDFYAASGSLTLQGVAQVLEEIEGRAEFDGGHDALARRDAKVREEGRLAERAAIVAWLRADGTDTMEYGRDKGALRQTYADIGGAYQMAADDIERGKHALPTTQPARGGEREAKKE